MNEIKNERWKTVTKKERWIRGERDEQEKR